jgi:hypothetical protein
MTLLANQNETLIAILGGIAVFVALGAFALVLFRSYERLARRSLGRKYAGLQIHEVPVAGDVTLTYHTYHGFIAWVAQTPHYVSLPPDHARILLGRLFRFNLTWGLLTYGALFIPPLAVWNYFTQRRSISSQEAENAIGANAAPATSGDVEGNPCASPQTAAANTAPSRSVFHEAIGWTCAVLCLIFGITTVVCFVRAEFEPAIGGLFATAVLGCTSWTWIGKRSASSQN